MPDENIKQSLEKFDKVLLECYVGMSDILVGVCRKVIRDSDTDLNQRASEVGKELVNNYRELLDKSVPYLSKEHIKTHRDKIRQLEQYFEVRAVA